MKPDESNISFISNVNICTTPFESYRGNKAFLNKVKDYYALEKLREYQGGNTNSNYYMFTYEQLKIISPDFSGVSYVRAEEDIKIAQENKEFDRQYGYIKTDKRELYPLIGDLQGYNSDIESFDENLPLAGTWNKVSNQSNADGNNPTFYAFKQLTKEDSNEYVDPHLQDDLSTDEDDPYYYLYRDTATSETSDLVTDPADIYLAKHRLSQAFLNTEQDTIIQADANDNIFVNAGPGTGKTYTLIQKINYLVSVLDVDPESIEVLCFTNAAVWEIKERLKQFVDNGGPRGLINVDIRTFHSFAWWLISQANELFVDNKEYHYQAVDMEKLSYDASLSKAQSIMKKYPAEIFNGWSHFIVDEIQDLTDVRARIVLTMVDACIKEGVGITVFGDSCQAIYDYNQEEVLFPMTSDEFYSRLFKLLYNSANFYSLNINHRMSEGLIGITSGLREAILSEDIGKMRTETASLRYQMDNIDGKYISNDITNEDLEELRDGGRICLLCRNNGQVLRLSTNLRKRGVDHIVNAYDNSEYFAGWIGAFFYGYTGSTLTYETFRKRVSSLGIPINCDLVWLRITDILGVNDEIINVNDLHESIIHSRKDDPVLRNVEHGNVIVSNIHRAKGREYETVIVEQQFLNRLIDKPAEIGEYKTLYVAVTRPKKHLYYASLVRNNYRLWDIFKTGRKRWMNYEYRQRKLTQMEIRANTDVDKLSYCDNDTQKYIIKNVKPGDEIRLERSDAGEIFCYKIIHIGDNGTFMIGKTTEALRDDIEALIEPNAYIDWPSSIDGLYVTGIYTEYSGYEESEKLNVWDWVDSCGLGHMNYDVY